MENGVDEPTATIAETERTRLRRAPEKGRFDREVINAVLDEALHCHLGFTDDAGQPYVIPTIHARAGETLYVHGSAASRMLRRLAGGVPVCCTVTLLDGIVVARSGFKHSMNHRSVVVLGTARLVDDPDEKLAALDAVVDHVLPGRTREIRPHTRNELAATTVVALPITEASAKVRTGDPVDDEDDLATDVWAGVIARRDEWLSPAPSADLAGGIPVPPSVAGFRPGA